LLPPCPVSLHADRRDRPPTSTNGPICAGGRSPSGPVHHCAGGYQLCPPAH
jgi:hypothetical protein